MFVKCPVSSNFCRRGEMSKSKKQRDDLIEAYRGYVKSICSKMMRRLSLPPELEGDLMGSGYVGLVEAAERYEIDSGTDFRTFAFLRIRGAVIDAIRRSSDLSPAAYRYSKALASVQSLREDLNLQLNSVDKTNGKVNLAKLLEYAAQGALAFRLSFVEAEEELLELRDEIDPEVITSSKSRSKFLRKLVSELPEKEKDLIIKYYFEDKSLMDIAQEDGAVSKSWLSRLHARAIGMLRQKCLEHIGAAYELL